MAFPASLSSTLLGCRDPRTLNGPDSKQARSSLRGGGAQRGRVGASRGQKLGSPKAYSSPRPTLSPNSKADLGGAGDLRTSGAGALTRYWR